MRFLLIQLIVVVMVEALGSRLSHRFGARALLWLLALLSLVCAAVGSIFVQACGGKGWARLFCALGWPLLVLGVAMTAIVIATTMQMRPRAWSPVVLLVLSLLCLWIAIYALQ